MLKLGSAFVEFNADMSGLQRAAGGVRQVMTGVASQVRGIGASAGAAFAGSVDRFKASFAEMSGMGKAFLFGGGFGIFKALQKTANANEVKASFAVMFGDLTKQAEEFVTAFGTAFGRSKTHLRESMTDWQAYFTSLNFGDADALKLSRTLVQLSYDLASFRGMDVSQAQESLLGGLAGRVEGLRKLGINMSETAMNAQLLKMGIAGGISAASDAQIAYARLAIIMDSLSKVHGNLYRNQQSMKNQWDTLGSQLSEMGTAIGASIYKYIEPVLPYITNMVRAIRGWIDANPALVTQLIALGAAMAAVFAFAPQIMAAFGMVATAIGFLATPIGLAVTALAGIAGYFLWTSAQGETLGQKLISVGQMIINGLSAVWDFLEPWVRVIIQCFKLIYDTIVSVFTAIGNVLSYFFGGTLGEGLKAFQTFAWGILTLLKNLNLAWDIAWGPMAVAVLSFVDMISQPIQALINNLKSVGALAQNSWKVITFRMSLQEFRNQKYDWKSPLDYGPDSPALAFQKDMLRKNIAEFKKNMGEEMGDSWNPLKGFDLASFMDKFKFQAKGPDFQTNALPEVKVPAPPTMKTEQRPEFVGLVDTWKRLQTDILENDPQKQIAQNTKQTAEAAQQGAQAQQQTADNTAKIAGKFEALANFGKYGP